MAPKKASGAKKSAQLTYFKSLVKQKNKWLKIVKKKLKVFHKKKARQKMLKTLKLITLPVLVMVILAFSSGTALRYAAGADMINGLSVSGENMTLALGGYDYQEAKKALNQEMNIFLNQNFNLIYKDETGEHSVTTNFKNLGVSLDINSTMKQAQSLSSGNNGFQHLKNRVFALAGSADVTPVFQINPVKFQMTVGQLFNLRNPQSAYAYVNEERQVVIKESQSGRGMDREIFTNELKSHLERLAWPEDVMTDIKTLLPTYTNQMALRDQTVWNTYLPKEIHLFYSKGLVNYENTLPAPIDWVIIENGTLTYNTEKIQYYLREFVSPEINQAKQDIYLKSWPQEGQSRSEIEGHAKKGMEVNIIKNSGLIIDAFEKNQRDVNLIVETVEPKLVDQTDTGIGDFILLGQGSSKFSGSTWSREYNITTTLADINGATIRPGEQFSFSKFLTYDWVMGKIISKGEFTDGFGGGACQPVTNAFRAGLDANLNILERRNHSMDVSWYYEGAVGDMEAETAQGLDATFYTGSIDLVMENPNDSPIIFHAFPTEEDDAYVMIFGKEKHHTTRMFGPYYSHTPVPEEFKELVGSIDYYSVVWIQQVEKQDIHDEDGDGDTTETIITNTAWRSRYPNINKQG